MKIMEDLKSKVISLRVTDVQYEQLTKRADKEKLKLKELMRKLLFPC